MLSGTSNGTPRRMNTTCMRIRERRDAHACMNTQVHSRTFVWISRACMKAIKVQANLTGCKYFWQCECCKAGNIGASLAACSHCCSRMQMPACGGSTRANADEDGPHRLAESQACILCGICNFCDVPAASMTLQQRTQSILMRCPCSTSLSLRHCARSGWLWVQCIGSVSSVAWSVWAVTILTATALRILSLLFLPDGKKQQRKEKREETTEKREKGRNNREKRKGTKQQRKEKKEETTEKREKRSLRMCMVTPPPECSFLCLT
jgi:hypothetical protein